MRSTQKEMKKAKTNCDLVLIAQEKIFNEILLMEVFNLQNLLELNRLKLTDFQLRITFP